MVIKRGGAVPTHKVLHGCMVAWLHGAHAAQEEEVHPPRRCCNPPRAKPFISSGVACGAAASGHYVWNDPTDVAQLLTCMMMSGPFLTGYTQTINDW